VQTATERTNPTLPRNHSRCSSYSHNSPPTQVSVERLFSGLKIIKSDLRASMKEDIADAVLFLKTYN